MSSSRTQLLHLSQDPKTHLLSECFAVHSDLVNVVEQFPKQAHLLPMSDNALVGLAIGMAIDGSFPIVQLASSESLYSLLPQLHQELKHDFPLAMVLRVPCFDLGSLNLNMLSSLPVAIYCSQNQEHSDLLISEAKNRKQPTILLESLPLMTANKKQPVAGGEIEILREGSDVSILAWGDGVLAALEAVETYASQGISLEVLVLHRLFSESPEIGSSIDKTGRVICLNQNDSLFSTVIAQSFWRLEAEPVFCSAESSNLGAAIQEVLSP